MREFEILSTRRKPFVTVGFYLSQMGLRAEDLPMCELARVAHSSEHREY